LLVVAALAVVMGIESPLSLAIVMGGPVAVLAATFSRARLGSAWDQLAAALTDAPDAGDVVAALKHLGRIHRTDGPLALERAAADATDPLLRRGIALALECNDEEELADILLAEARRNAAEGEAARHVLVTLGKLFPAFGLIGTLVGLALLLRHLGEASLAAIGPGLALAVLTTLYGAVLANVVVLPLATRLHTHLVRRALRTQMIIDGVLLVHRREFPTRIERALRGYVGGAGEPSAHVVDLTERAA